MERPLPHGGGLFICDIFVVNMDYFSLTKSFLYRLDPENAHHLVLWALQRHLVPKAKPTHYPVLSTRLWDIDFPNPIGLAAGFDKNACALNSLLAQGFGFVEAGTVTPRPQIGNPRPRLFRLDEDLAIINRMGFNNEGLEPFKAHMAAPREGIVGSNIGRNKEAADPVEDYLTLFKELYNISDYLVINISSPNTPGLRAMQGKDALSSLLIELNKARQELHAGSHKHTPVVIKIAPDMADREMEDIAEAILTYHMDGLIISNTTTGERDKLISTFKHENGGLSGKPLAQISTRVLRHVRRVTEGKIPLIGVGGVTSGDDAYHKIRSGASLVQIYSTLIYQGFSAVETIKARLSELLLRDGFSSISEAVGIDVKK